MTQAVCFRCGEIKFGSFCPCGKCRAVPATDDDLALSLAMSDHYFSMDELRAMGERIRRGLPVSLNEEQRVEMVAMIRELTQQPQWKKKQAKMLELAAAPRKPWWKFW